MNFGTVLRQLLALNDIKIYDLADSLGYDKSYISKWLNHVKLPPSKEIDRISDEIAQFLTKQCTVEQRRITAREFDLSQKDGNTPGEGEFSKRVAELLKRAYWNSRTQAGAAAARQEAAPNRIRRNENIECILATQPVTGSNHSQNALEDLDSLVADGAHMRLQVLLDLSRFEKNVDLYWKHICRLLSLDANVDVELIESGDRSDLPDRLLIAKDRFVIQTATLPFSDRTVALRIESPPIVDLYYDDARRFLHRQQFVLESSNTNENLYYYKYAATDEKKRYLLSSMFPIYMDENLFRELLDKFGRNKHSYPREYLKEFVAPKSVMIYDSALLRYMSTGKIATFGAYEEALTKSERRRHLQGLIDELEDGSRLEIMILSDKNPLLNYEDINVSFFMNNNSAYSFDIKRKADGIRYFMSFDCRKHLSAFLDHLYDLGQEHMTDRKQTIDYIYNGMKNL